MKKTSCGILLIVDNSLLMCHVTLSNPSRWDIPKGELNPDENPVDCAIRELEEETGLVISRDNLINLNIFHYLPNKVLHLYLAKQELPDITKMNCTSYFDMFGIQHPEVDDFMFVPFCEVKNYASKSLFLPLNQALQLFTY